MTSMQEYLKRYSCESDKKKKKKKKKSKPLHGGSLNIVDADPVWQKEIKDDISETESEKEDAPLIIEDLEFKRLKRLEMLRTRPYLSTAADGSGWVPVNESQTEGLQGEDLVAEMSRAEEKIDFDKSPRSREKDVSPSRKAHQHSPQILPQGDSSPPRSRQQHQDLSPPRRQLGRKFHDFPELITGAGDLSPPRREPDLAKKRNMIGTSSPGRASRISSKQEAPNNKDGDLSPLRRHPKRVRHDSPESAIVQRDRSLNGLPNRRVQIYADKDVEAAANIRDGDLSPPRRHLRQIRHDSPESANVQRDRSLNGSPNRRVQIYADKDVEAAVNIRDGDLSPPRRHLRQIRHDSPESASLQTTNYEDESFPRGVQTHFYKDDMLKRNNRYRDRSPPKRDSRRIRHDSPESVLLRSGKTSGKSPPEGQNIHARNDGKDLSPTRRRHIDDFSAGELPKAKRKEDMQDGTSAGLKSGKDIAKEAMLKKNTDFRRVKELDSAMSGRNANTVYRDKHGRRLEGVDEILKLQQAEQPKEDKPLEWGKGLVQKKEAEARFAEIEAEKAKPFARTIQDLDAMLREQVRWGDPMAHLVKKKMAEPALVDLGANEKMKDSGFIIPQEIPAHSWLKRGTAAPPNRYDIKPGRHWDGVDRSTGYERDMYKRQNERKAQQEEAYLWSVADM